MYRQLFALFFWSIVIVSGAIAAKAAPVGQPCSVAQDSYASAKAAQMNADMERASSLYRTTIEQFEACRAQENMQSSNGLKDASSEADALIAAASIAISNQEMERAHALLIGAAGLLTELCKADSLPSDVSTQVGGNVLGLRRFGAMAGVAEFGACPAAQIPAPFQTP